MNCITCHKELGKDKYEYKKDVYCSLCYENLIRKETFEYLKDSVIIGKPVYKRPIRRDK